MFLESQGQTLSVFDKPPHQYFYVIALASESNPLAHEQLHDTPVYIVFGYAEMRAKQYQSMKEQYVQS